MALYILLALQLVATAAAIGFLWRRSERQRQDIDKLREQLGVGVAQRAPQQQQRARPVALAAVSPAVPAATTRSVVSREPPVQRATQTWRLPEELDRQLAALPISRASLRGFAMAVATTAPAWALLWRVDIAVIVAAGVIIGAAMMLLSLQSNWRAAAWASVFTAGAWALLGFVTTAAHAEPLVYCSVLPLAGAAGLAQAYLRRAAHGAAIALAPGATLALVMSAAALALGSQIGMVGPPGIAFAAIVSMGAIVGAMNVKLEPIHLAAFGATLIGLFVMSGQDTAAIWFTPITAWAGALFLGVSAVRVPKIGARGAAIAATGVIATLTAVASLYGSDQGLADPRAAAAGFGALALLYIGIIAMAARWHDRGLAGLKMTLWLLGGGALVAASAAVFLVLPASYAAPAFAAMALMCAAGDVRFGNLIWRTSVAILVALTLANAWASAEMMLGEATTPGPWTTIGAGLALPAILGAIGGRIATRNDATLTAALLEGAAIALGMTAASLGIRYYFSGGAPLLHGITFVEAGAHVATWLLAAMLIAARSRRDARRLRSLAATTLGTLSLGVSALTSVLWLTPYWENHPAATDPAPFQHEGLGFALPAILFWVSWVFWRARGSSWRTRFALGAAALMTAGFITLEAMKPTDGSTPGTLNALLGAVTFALAIVLNFAPGVVAGPFRRSYLEENLKRDRRSEQRRQAG